MAAGAVEFATVGLALFELELVELDPFELEPFELEPLVAGLGLFELLPGAAGVEVDLELLELPLSEFPLFAPEFALVFTLGEGEEVGLPVSFAETENWPVRRVATTMTETTGNLFFNMP